MCVKAARGGAGEAGKGAPARSGGAGATLSQECDNSQYRMRREVAGNRPAAQDGLEGVWELARYRPEASENVNRPSIGRDMG